MNTVVLIVGARGWLTFKRESEMGKKRKTVFEKHPVDELLICPACGRKYVARIGDAKGFCGRRKCEIELYPELQDGR